MEKQHKIWWDEVNIIGQESNSIEQNIIEAFFMAASDGCISQPSTVWLSNEQDFL